MSNRKIKLQLPPLNLYIDIYWILNNLNIFTPYIVELKHFITKRQNIYLNLLEKYLWLVDFLK